MSEIPTPVSESTAIEVVRKEGSTLSVKSVDNTITAGDILMFNASGVLKQAGGIGSGDSFTLAGVTLYTCASGNRTVVIRGKVRATWDGVNTGNFGVPIAPSLTHSGWFETSSGLVYPIGVFIGNGGGSQLAAANSGTLQVVEIY